MRMVIAIVVILVGIQLLLTAVGVKNVPPFDDWWPAVLIVVGLASWKSNPKIFFWPLTLVVLGAVLLLVNYGVLPGNSWDYIWPAIIILIGLSMLMNRGWRHWGKHEGSGEHVAAVFSGREEKVVGEFTKGSASATFGGTKFDLRGAKIVDNAELDVYAAFGGIEINVPRDVQVRVRVTPIFGGSENKTEPEAGATKTLTVSGTAMFGGIEVKN